MVKIEFRILSCYLRQDSRRFTEICKEIGFPTDLGGYYIRRLVQGGYLTKNQRGTYMLTPKGKQQLVSSRGLESIANRPRLCAMIIAQQNDAYMVLERIQQPFIGIVEWPAGMLANGEAMAAGAERILLERLGISGKPAYWGMFRRIDTYKGSVFDDKLFAIHTYTLPSRTVIQQENRKGRNVLYGFDQLHKLTTPSKSLLHILHFVTASMAGFEERTYQLRRGDLFEETRDAQKI